VIRYGQNDVSFAGKWYRVARRRDHVSRGIFTERAFETLQRNTD